MIVSGELLVRMSPFELLYSCWGSLSLSLIGPAYYTVGHCLSTYDVVAYAEEFPPAGQDRWVWFLSMPLCTFSKLQLYIVNMPIFTLLVVCTGL